MGNFFEQLKNEGKRLRLSEDEKIRMRAALFGAPVATPGFFVLRFSHMQYAFAALLIVVLGGGTTVSAAQGALPGDLLYPVKVSLNERVELALATTPQKQIETEVKFAERRVAEAEALEAEGRLSSEVTVELEREFDKHASRVLALTEDKDTSPPQSTETEVATTQMKTQEAVSFKVEAEVEDVAHSTALMQATSSEEDEEKEEVKAEDGNADLVKKLGEKKEVLRTLKARLERRERGEVRGRSVEDRSHKDEDVEDEPKGVGDSDR